MKKKMPQSPQSHVNDKRAIDNLTEIFPEQWKFTKSGDFRSGIEYGNDWLCEITDQANDLSNVTGAMFHIQSKTTEKPLGRRSRRLGMSLKVSTLNRLYVLNLPVMLHYYHQPSDTGFWMWLEDYYQREYQPEWERKEKITVYLPTKNVLDESAAEKIRLDVLKFQKRHNLQKQVETANKIDPNYSFRFATTSDYTGIDVFPKHPNALIDHPIGVNLMLDAAANEILIRSIELGESVEFEADADFAGLPQWLTEDIDEQAKAQIILSPLVEENSSHLQFEYLDEQNNSLYKSNLVEMRLAQSGTKYKRFEGKSQTDPLIFTIIVDAIKPQNKFSISYYAEKRGVETIDWYYNLLDKLARTKTARILNLDTGQVNLLENHNPFTKTNEVHPIARQFTKNMAIISNALNIGISFPNEPRPISEQDSIRAEATAEVIHNGKTYKLTNVPSDILQAQQAGHTPMLIIGYEIPLAKKILSELESEGCVYIESSVTSPLTILDYSINLGPAKYYVCCTGILNSDAIIQTFSMLVQAEYVELQLTVDLAKSYMEFKNWLPVQELIDEISDRAQSRGLTPEIFESLLNDE